VRELPVSEEVVNSETVVYEVKVVTGDRRGAGTDANVSIMLYGENGNSERPKVLQSSSSNFERGATDVFGVDSKDLGNLTKIRIGHDGVGFGSGWFLDKIYVTHPLSKQQWTFLCGRWLDKSEDDGKIERELVPSADAVISQPCMSLTKKNFEHSN
jgi:lipoxygenase homology domain-containing protein 1